jgi:alpha-glucosidase
VPGGGADGSAGLGEPWLPQPDAWAELTVERQEADPASTLRHYRRLLAARRALIVPTEPLVWLETPPDVLAFRRGGLQCWVAFGTDPVPLPPGLRVALSSTGHVDGVLPPDTAVWLVPGGS